MYREFKSNDICQMVIYQKDEKSSDYIENEKIKTNNLYRIVKELEKIVKEFKPDLVQIEGISYGSAGSAALADLSGLQFMVRQMLIDNNVPFNVVSPTQNKKFATGNGSADKDLMVYSWLHCVPKQVSEYFKSLPKGIKVDDIADAYFLSKYHL